MAFFEELFPTEVGRNMVGGPRALVQVAYASSGQRFVNDMDPEPLHEWSLAYPVQIGEEFEALRAFAYVINVNRDAFRFEDPADHEATQQNSGMALISAGVYQLTRRYTYGARSKVRPIYKPVAGAQIFRTRSGFTTNITGTSSVSTTTGQVTVSGHIGGDTYTWAGDFHIPVHFRDAAAVWRFLGGSRMLTEWPDIALVESREIA